MRRSVFLIDAEGVIRYRHVALFGLRYQDVGDLERAVGALSPAGAGPRPEPFGVEGRARASKGEAVGEGPPIVLLHGVTATRRYVLHGSSALARRGFACSPTTPADTGSPSPLPTDRVMTTRS